MDHIQENTLYNSPATKELLLKDKQGVANAFWINFLGTLGLFKISSKRGTMKTHFQDDGKLIISNIGDDNKDVSLSVKLYHETGGLTTKSANQITKLLHLIKTRKVTDKNLDDAMVREMVSHIKYQSHRPHQVIFNIIEKFANGDYDLKQTAKILYDTVKQRKKDFAPFCAEWYNLAKQYLPYFSKIDTSVKIPTATTVSAPIVTIDPVAATDTISTTKAADVEEVPAKTFVKIDLAAEVEKAIRDVNLNNRKHFDELEEKTGQKLDDDTLKAVLLKVFESSTTPILKEDELNVFAGAYLGTLTRAIPNLWAAINFTTTGVTIARKIQHYDPAGPDYRVAGKSLHKAAEELAALFFGFVKDLAKDYDVPWATASIMAEIHYRFKIFGNANKNFLTSYPIPSDMPPLTVFLLYQSVGGDKFKNAWELAERAAASFGLEVKERKADGVVFGIKDTSASRDHAKDTLLKAIGKQKSANKVPNIDFDFSMGGNLVDLVMSAALSKTFVETIWADRVDNKTDWKLSADLVRVMYNKIIKQATSKQLMTGDGLFNQPRTISFAYGGDNRYDPPPEMSLTVGSLVILLLSKATEDMRASKYLTEKQMFEVCLTITKATNSWSYTKDHVLSTAIADFYLACAEYHPFFFSKDRFGNIATMRGRMNMDWKRYIELMVDAPDSELPTEVATLYQVVSPHFHQEYREIGKERIKPWLDRLFAKAKVDDDRTKQNIIERMRIPLTWYYDDDESIYREFINTTDNTYLYAGKYGPLKGKLEEYVRQHFTTPARDFGGQFATQRIIDSFSADELKRFFATLPLEDISTDKGHYVCLMYPYMTDAQKQKILDTQTVDVVIDNLIKVDKNVDTNRTECERIIRFFDKNKEQAVKSNKNYVSDWWNRFLVVASEPEVEQFYSSLNKDMKKFVVSNSQNASMIERAYEKIRLDDQPIKPSFRSKDDMVKFLKTNSVDITKSSERFSEKKGYYEIINSTKTLDKITDFQMVEDTSYTQEALEKLSIELDKANSGRHGNVSVHVDKVFNVDLTIQSTEAEKWLKANKKGKEMVPVYHGTGDIGASMILRFGFKVIKSNNATVAGRMLGDGIYFSDVLDKVAQYCNNEGNTLRHHGQVGYIFEMRAYLGQPIVNYRCAGPNLQNDPGVVRMSRQIISDEWCVKDGNGQLRILRCFQVRIESKETMRKLKEKHAKLNEAKTTKLSFGEFLTEAGKESKTDIRGQDCLTFVFRDGRIPVGDETVSFDEFDMKVPQNIRFDVGPLGLEVKVYGVEKTDMVIFDYASQLFYSEEWTRWATLTGLVKK